MAGNTAYGTTQPCSVGDHEKGAAPYLAFFGGVRHVWLGVCKPTHDVACDDSETLLVRGLNWSAATSLITLA